MAVIAETVAATAEGPGHSKSEIICFHAVV